LCAGNVKPTGKSAPAVKIAKAQRIYRSILEKQEASNLGYNLDDDDDDDDDDEDADDDEDDDDDEDSDDEDDEDDEDGGDATRENPVGELPFMVTQPDPAIPIDEAAVANPANAITAGNPSTTKKKTKKKRKRSSESSNSDQKTKSGRNNRRMNAGQAINNLATALAGNSGGSDSATQIANIQLQCTHFLSNNLFIHRISPFEKFDNLHALE
jgi:hypothetical protein